MSDLPKPFTDADRVIPLSPGRIAQTEVLRAYQGSARCNAVRFLDLERLHRYWDAHPEADGVRLTLTAFYVRAAALALREQPRPAWHLYGYREVQPTQFDIGLSVAGTIPESPMAPTIVVRDCLNKSLPAIAQEIRDRSREARDHEARELEELGKIVRWFPLGPLRRWLVRVIGTSFAVRRQAVGVLQISNCHGLGIDIPFSSVVATSLVLPGEVRPYAVVVDGEVRAHRGAWCTFQFDHSEFVASTIGAWLQAFDRWLQQPERLYLPPEDLLRDLQQ